MYLFIYLFRYLFTRPFISFIYLFIYSYIYLFGWGRRLQTYNTFEETQWAAVTMKVEEMRTPPQLWKQPKERHFSMETCQG